MANVIALVCLISTGVAAADGGTSQTILEELRAIKENQVAQQKQIVDLEIENSFLRARLSEAENSVQRPRQLKEVDFSGYSGVEVKRAKAWVVSRNFTCVCMLFRQFMACIPTDLWRESRDKVVHQPEGYTHYRCCERC